MFRCYFLVFHGDFRGDDKAWHHAHESPSAMTIPLGVLAAGSVAIGALGVPEAFRENSNLFEEWLVPSNFAPLVSHEGAAVEWGLMAVATLVSLGGIALAWRLYGRGLQPAAAGVPERWPRLYKVVSNKYYVDEIYDALIVKPLRGIAFFLWKVVDALLIDLVLVRGSALVVDLFGRALRYAQNGDVQRYVVGVVVGTTAIVGVSANWVVWSAAKFDVQQSGADATVHAHGIPKTVDRPIEFLFDFGDGTPELKQQSPVAKHHFAAGKHKVSVTAYDPRWHTRSKETHVIEVKP
jgi:hypothetical protein